MKKLSSSMLSILLGFSAGAVIGFVWAQETKSRMAENVRTDFSDGKLTVTVDAQNAAVEGLQNIFR